MRCNNKNFLKLFLLFFPHICTAKVKRKSYKNYRLLEVQGKLPDVMTSVDYINAIDDSATYAVRGSKVEVLLRPSLLSRFQKFAKTHNVKLKVVVSDFSKILEQERVSTLRNKGNFSWTEYYGVDDIHTFLKTLHEEHPSSSTLINIGESYLGQQILGLRINTNVTPQKSYPKPVIVIEAGIHAREWLTPAVTTYFMNELLKRNTSDFKHFRDSFDWHIFPTVNPDGYRYSLLTERMWRKNRSRSNTSICIGVDLNRNWDFKFRDGDASDNPCSYQSYRGSKAFSEIESRLLSSYISKLDNLISYLAIHTYGSCIVLPYDIVLGNSSQMEQIAINAIRRSGVLYDIFSSKRVFGRNIAGTSMDWVHEVKKPPIAFSLELRDYTFFTPSNRILSAAEEATNLLAGLFKEAQLLAFV